MANSAVAFVNFTIPFLFITIVSILTIAYIVTFILGVYFQDELSISLLSQLDDCIDLCSTHRGSLSSFNFTSINEVAQIVLLRTIISILILYATVYYMKFKVTPRLHYPKHSVYYDQIWSKMKTLKNGFWPSFFSTGGHSQSTLFALWPGWSIFLRQSKIGFSREVFKLRDGGVVALDWAIVDNQAESNFDNVGGVVIVCPGVFGLSDNAYIQSLSLHLHRRMKFRLVVKSWRGIGVHLGEKFDRPETWSDTSIDDLREVVYYIYDCIPKNIPIFLAGFSMGACMCAGAVGRDRLYPLDRPLGLNKIVKGVMCFSGPFNYDVPLHQLFAQRPIPYDWLNMKAFWSLVSTYSKFLSDNKNTVGSSPTEYSSKPELSEAKRENNASNKETLNISMDNKRKISDTSEMSTPQGYSIFNSPLTEEWLSPFRDYIYSKMMGVKRSGSIVHKTSEWYRVLGEDKIKTLYEHFCSQLEFRRSLSKSSYRNCPSYLWHDLVTIHFTGDDSVESYLRNNTDKLLKYYRHISSVPTLSLMAVDDPLIPEYGAIEFYQIAEGRRNLENSKDEDCKCFVVTRRGGHCGFFRHILGYSWQNEVCEDFFKLVMKSL